MNNFKAVEYRVSDKEIVATGKVEYYFQAVRKSAVKACLYTHKLNNPAAFAGETGCVVHDGDFCYAVMCDMAMPYKSLSLTG